MKKFLPLLILLFISVTLFAQAPDKCATMQVLSRRAESDQSIMKRMKEAEDKARPYLNNDRSGNLARIPVVVHVIYKTAAQNIPDSMIHSQIESLNNDYRRTNADTSNTRAEFKAIAADINVEFQLATVDPNGNPTTGITRTPTTVNSFDPFSGYDKMKSSATGGVDAWPTDRYFNIWVCDMSFMGTPFVLGYAQFPGDSAETDGVVIQYQYFGRTNSSATAPNNLGRTASHEVGHWLGLRHIWGDDSGCDSTDYVDDTPNAKSESQSDCNVTKNSCVDTSFSGVDMPDMVENYMDYSADGCMNMFTNGQKQRMWSFLQSHRSAFIVTGLKDLSMDSGVSIYPNPSTGLVAISGLSSALRSVKIYNATGSLVHSAMTTNTLNVSHLENGVYFLQIMGNSGLIHKKLILSK